MLPIRFASFLAENALDFYCGVVAYLGEATGLPTEMVTGLPAEEQDTMVDRAEIQVVFTCGLPYVLKADRSPPHLRVMAAPVLATDDYQNRAVYFSHVIVRNDAPIQDLAGLRGASFAFNEEYSLSGYFMVWHHMLDHSLSPGQPARFFGNIVKSGSHAISMDWVEQGRVDAAAIDSVVLEMELAQRPERAASFRVIERIGPCPMPPVAAVTGLAEAWYGQLRQALVTMHRCKEGQALLQREGVRRFAPVCNRDYDPIRQIVQDLRQAGLMPHYH